MHLTSPISHGKSQRDVSLWPMANTPFQAYPHIDSKSNFMNETFIKWRFQNLRVVQPRWGCVSLAGFAPAGFVYAPRDRYRKGSTMKLRCPHCKSRMGYYVISEDSWQCRACGQRSRILIEPVGTLDKETNAN